MIGPIFAVLFYVVYAWSGQAWTNVGLMALATMMTITGPLFSRLSNRIDAVATARTRLALIGRLARLIFQTVVNMILISLLLLCAVVRADALVSMGGLLLTAFMITVGSQGLQYAALWIADRKWGTPEANVLGALSLSLVVNASALTGMVAAQQALIILNIALIVVGVALAARNDAIRLGRHRP